MIIENFNSLSEEELSEFATALVNKINDEQTFIKYEEDKVEFDIDRVETNELDGSLEIQISTKESMSIARSASWTADDPDSLNSYSDLDFTDTDLQAAQENLKTISTEVDGYTIELTDIEFEKDSVDEVEWEDYECEGGGIGDYEYWGHRCHDYGSEYCTVYGVAYCSQTLMCTLVVTAK